MAMASSYKPEVTASTCSPATAHGAHLFKIERYSLYKGMGVGKCIRSATFAVGGHDWCLCFYPDGDKEASKDWVSVFLELKTNDVVARAVYDMTLIDQTTRLLPRQSLTCPNPGEIDLVVFDSTTEEQDAWGSSKFIKRSELENSNCLLDDTIIVACNLTVITFHDAQAQEAQEIGSDFKVPRSDLSDNLSKLLENTEGSDVSFKVKEEVFPAHKIILAMRSPVFRAELYGPMREQSLRSVVVEDMQPAVFKGLLHFIYTDSLPPMDGLSADEYEEMIRHLLVAADRYAMERMKLMCEKKLGRKICEETVATTLALADQHHCSKLKDACIEFINSLSTMDEVVASKGYEHLKRACPTVFVDIWEKATKARKI